MVSNLDYEGIKFPVSRKDYSRIEQKSNICINVFSYENNLLYLFIYQIKNLKIMIYYWYQIKISHTMCLLRVLTDLCVIRQNVGLKNTFENIVFNVLEVKKPCKNTKKIVWK